MDASQRVQKQTGDALESLASNFYGDAIKMAAQAHGFKEVVVKAATSTVAAARPHKR